MGKRKRTPRRDDLVGRAVSVGRRALREAESRLPADLRRQLDRRLKDADKTARAAIKQLQAQVRRATTRADVNSVLKRIDDLTRQARQIAQGATLGPTPAKRRRATTTRTAASRTRQAAGAARPAGAAKVKTGASGAAGGRSATRRRSSPRRTRASEAMPEVSPVVDEIEVVEVIEG